MAVQAISASILLRSASCGRLAAPAEQRHQRVFMKGVGTARPQFRPAGVQESGDEAVPTPAIRLHAYALCVRQCCLPDLRWLSDRRRDTTGDFLSKLVI